MGSLNDPVLRDFHDRIQQSLYWSSKPDYQKTCEILNGMNMVDMLDELWRIRMTGKLDDLANAAYSATGVNIPRLRAAMGAVQTQPPGDFDALLRTLPADQQRSIKNVRAVTQAPPLNPLQWSRYYWSVRCLPALYYDFGLGKEQPDGAKGDDDDPHLAADVASGLTANAPRGKSPVTYTATLVYRNLNGFRLIRGNDEFTFLHEPNFSVQVSPDPSNKVAVNGAVSLINAHVKRNWGLLKPDVEFSVGAQGGVNNPGMTPNATVQAQVELHLTTTISLTATSSLGIAPAGKPGGPPDYGSYHAGNRDVDMSFTPIVIGILGHWDPPGSN
jgi:hypothetical protein